MKTLWFGPLAVVCASGWLALRSFEGLAEEADKPATEAGKGSPSGAYYKLVAPLNSVMYIVDRVFEGMQEKLKASKFKELRREAFFLAEMAHLATQLEDRCKKKEWVALGERMMASALQMAQDAGKKDEASFKKFHAQLGESCESCHDKYRD